MTSSFSSDLVLETSLQCYFFDQLAQLNRIQANPLANEDIFYSSLVMDKFGMSHQLFEQKEGRPSEKILGLKLMQASHLPKKKRIRELKDIGDTALFICGFFQDSLNKKIVDVSYYRDIGQAAYSKLNHLVPSFYDVDSFYNEFSKKFNNAALLMEILSRECLSNAKEDDLIWIAS
ncbi:hypothetical protein [Halobacteriovorax marinus]|uniref:hypothetical protein n=1 Tax=Halobacteriovorax marinus TaxID=97084 RepID=UPI003A9014FE